MSRTDDLERLERLRNTGALSEGEFQREKGRLLSSASSGASPRWKMIVGIVIAIVVIVLVAVAWGTSVLRKPIDTPTPVASPVVGAMATDAIAPPATSALPADNASDTNSDGDVNTYAESPPKTGRCQLQVKGIDYINGPCTIIASNDGSFSIMQHYSATKFQPGYFAEVQRDGSSTDGYWNAEPASDHASDSLGALTRDGACWQNANAKICAWEK